MTTTNGWHHEALHHGVLALKALAQQYSFEAVLLEDPDSFTDQHLASFQAIVFLHTTGDILNAEQQKVMERFIQSEKGFVDIHSASDMHYHWEWYTKLVGRLFYIHPAVQTAKPQVVDSSFPGLQGFAGSNGKVVSGALYSSCRIVVSIAAQCYRW